MFTEIWALYTVSGKNATLFSTTTVAFLGRSLKWYHIGPSRVTPNKGSGPPIWETVYISKVNGARKVKSNT